MKRFLLARPNGDYNRDDTYNTKPLKAAIQAKVSNKPVDGWRVGLKPRSQGEADIRWRGSIVSKGAALGALMDLCAGKDNVGDLYVMEHVDSGYQIRVRVVEEARKLVIDGTPALRRVHREVTREFGKKLVSWGRRACRSIAGTSTPSDHALLPEPAAEDWHGSARDMKALKNFLVDNHARLDLNYVIYDGRIYSDSNGWKGAAYTGSCPHRQHVHVSVNYNHANARYC